MEGLYQMQYHTNDFDGPSFANGKQMHLWFQAMSNELLMPKIVVCPADDRSPATNFTSDFGPAHVSYFVGASSSRPSPTDFLSGDSNLTNDLASHSGTLEISAKKVPRWGGKRHEDNGNVLFADGKVQKLSNRDLRVAIIPLGSATNKVVLP
jgi:prepilin-type processing-associated H-X9-DG protein